MSQLDAQPTSMSQLIVNPRPRLKSKMSDDPVDDPVDDPNDSDMPNDYSNANDFYERKVFTMHQASSSQQ